MLLHDARREARTRADGTLVLLEDQDRGLWDRSRIDEGRELLDRALRMRRAGPIQLQAAIAALHDEAASAGETDWAQIATLYAALGRLAPSPVVELNRGVAVAMASSAEAGLRIIDSLVATGELDEYPYLHAARADLLRRLGRAPEAADAYARARSLTANVAEQAFLDGRLAEVGASGD
jgi:RNA polymerase sigma-70 factor (ECF subfamily)